MLAKTWQGDEEPIVKPMGDRGQQGSGTPLHGRRLKGLLFCWLVVEPGKTWAPEPFGKQEEGGV